jgi:hypothetical protein
VLLSFREERWTSKVEDARIVGDAKTAFKLKYDFHYNESENAIQISYWFTTAIAEKATRILRYVPHARGRRYLRPKRRGRKPDLDALFDDPEEMRWVTSQAEAKFEQALGQTIDIALQLFIHQTMYQCGVLAWTDESKSMADLFAKAFRDEIAEQLKVRPGRESLFRDADHYRRTLYFCMRQAARDGEFTSGDQFTQEMAGKKIAQRIKPNADAFDPRKIRDWNKEYGVKWREFVKQTWQELAAEVRSHAH